MLVTDVTMPNMNGIDLCLAIRESRPDLKTLFMSGYSNELFRVHPKELPENSQFIEKPYQLPTLVAKIKEMLTK